MISAEQDGFRDDVFFFVFITLFEFCIFIQCSFCLPDNNANGIPGICGQDPRFDKAQREHKLFVCDLLLIFGYCLAVQPTTTLVVF